MLLAILAALAPMTVVEKPDALTDLPSAFAVAMDGRTRLAIGCFQAGDPPMVVLNTDRWLRPGSDWTNKRRISQRFDEGPIDRVEWVIVDNQVAQLSDPKEVRRFVRSVIASARLRIRAEALSLPDIDMDFQLANAGAAVAKAYQLCRVDPEVRAATLPE